MDINMKPLYQLLLLITVLAALLTTNAVEAVECDDDSCGTFNGTSYFACCAGLTLRAYCMLKFSENAVFMDGQCDRYRTTSPTLNPTKIPTRQPTRFLFPTQSPQTQEEYNSYFTKNPTAQPTGLDGLPHPEEASSSGGSPVVGLAVGIVILAAFFGVVFVYRRRAKRTRALHETEFGAGSASIMHPQRSNQNEYDLAMT